MIRAIFVTCLCTAAVLLAWHFYCGGIIPGDTSHGDLLRYIPQDTESATVFSAKLVKRAADISPRVKKSIKRFEKIIGLKAGKNITAFTLAQLPGVYTPKDIFNLEGKLLIVKHNKNNSYDHLISRFRKQRISHREQSMGHVRALKLASGLDGKEMWLAFPQENIICIGRYVDVESALKAGASRNRNLLYLVKRSSTARKTLSSKYEIASYYSKNFVDSNDLMLSASGNDQNNSGVFACFAGKFEANQNLGIIGEIKADIITPAKMKKYIDRFRKYAPSIDKDEVLKYANIYKKKGVWNFDVKLSLNELKNKNLIVNSELVATFPINIRTPRPQPRRPRNNPQHNKSGNDSVAIPPNNRRRSSPSIIEHVVRNGDTLYKITKRYLGNGNRWTDLVKANPELQLNPNQLRKGQIIVIPLAP